MVERAIVRFQLDKNYPGFYSGRGAWCLPLNSFRMFAPRIAHELIASVCASKMELAWLVWMYFFRSFGKCKFVRILLHNAHIEHKKKYAQSLVFSLLDCVNYSRHNFQKFSICYFLVAQIHFTISDWVQRDRQNRISKSNKTEFIDIINFVENLQLKINKCHIFTERIYHFRDKTNKKWNTV